MEVKELLDRLEREPVVAAVKDDRGLGLALESQAEVIFLLYGSVLTVDKEVRRAHEAGKAAFVHLDLVEGLAPREVSVDFIAKHTCADGVLSTKAALTRRARELGLIAIQRFFLLDSMAIQNIEKHLEREAADLIEVLPGLMPKIIRRVSAGAGKPVIAGGLISEKEDVIHALAAGAVAVSSTAPDIWEM
jgi:glycerol uptake operon antiterminator